MPWRATRSERDRTDRNVSPALGAGALERSHPRHQTKRRDRAPRGDSKVSCRWRPPTGQRQTPLYGQDQSHSGPVRSVGAVSEVKDRYARIADALRRPGGFGASLESAPGADEQTRLLYFSGRAA